VTRDEKKKPIDRRDSSSNGVLYLDESPTDQSTDAVSIKLQADADGRYGFNVKVIKLMYVCSIDA
jgi:hypothetical protein